MTDQEDEMLKQLPLDFKVCEYMGRDDFMVSRCNRKAFELIDSWPNWLAGGLFMYGPQGCGKTHLAHLWVDKIRQSKINQKVSIMSAAQINNRNVKRLAENYTAVVIENVSPRNNDEALFHLFNMFAEEGKYMLWTAEKPANLLRFSLPDLQTRLNMLPAAAIEEPDDEMLRMLIAKLFNDRQIIIGQDILDYILNNARRSFAYIRDLVSEIDRVSLAYQSAVNYNVVKKAMDELAQKETREPDLFDEY